MNFATLTVSIDQHIARVSLNRPDKANAMNMPMWQEIRSAFKLLDADPTVRVVTLEGAGAHFTAGIDLEMMLALGPIISDPCEARTREKLRRLILDLQDTLTSIERCRKPVLAAIHGACVGGGVDLICCCDMRYAAADAHFSIKEIDIGMTADVGTLQRLPKLVGDGIVRELAYTGRRMSADEAHNIGLVNRVWPNVEELQRGVLELATQIAAKSPLSIRGVKEMLVYARDHSVADGLNHVATWNAAMLMSADLQEAMLANMSKRAAVFPD